MHISIVGMKSENRVLNLNRLSFVVGSNAQGKSTIGEAVRFVALGHIPALGRKPEATAALLRGRSLEVEWQIDDLHTVTRGLKRGAEGNYETTALASWVKGKNTKPGVEIQKLFGANEDDIEQFLDIRELLNLSGNKRAAVLQALLSTASATPEQLAAMVAEQTVQRLSRVESRHMPDNYLDLLPLLSEKMRSTLKGVAPLLLARLCETGIAGVVTWAQGHKREHAAAAKNKTAAAHELKERLAGSSEAAAEEITRLTADRDRLQGELGEAKERSRAANARRATIEAAARELRRAAEVLDAARARRESVSHDVVAHAGDPRRLAEIEAELDAMQSPSPQEQPEAGDLLAQASECERKAKGVAVPETSAKRSVTIQGEIDSLSKQIETAQQSPWTRVREIGLAIDLDAVGKSERIVRLQALADELRTLADAHAPDLQALKRKLADSKQWLADALDEERAQAADRQGREQARTDYLREAERCRTAATELMDTAAAAYERERVAFAARRNPLITERDTLRRGIELRRQDASDADTALARAEEAHKAATQRETDLGETPEAIEDGSTDLQAQLDDCKARLSEHARLQAARDELAAIIVELDRAQVLRDVFTALEWAAQQVRAQQVTEAGGPLKQHMRRFLAAAGRREEPFFHAAGGVCDLGWITAAGDEVLVQALSGAEWVLYTTALVYAMLMLRDPLVKVLLVDAGHCDDVNTAALLRAIETVSQDLTLALVEHYRVPAEVPTAWQVIALDGARTAQAA